MTHRRQSQYFQTNEDDTDVAEMMQYSNPIEIIANERRTEISNRPTNNSAETSPRRRMSEDERDVEQMALQPFDWSTIARIPGL